MGSPAAVVRLDDRRRFTSTAAVDDRTLLHLHVHRLQRLLLLAGAKVLSSSSSLHCLLHPSQSHHHWDGGGRVILLDPSQKEEGDEKVSLVISIREVGNRRSSTAYTAQRTGFAQSIQQSAAGCSNRRPPIENYKQRPWQPDRWQSNGVALIRRAPLTGHKQTQTPRLCCLCIPRLDCTVIKWLGTRTLFFKNIFLYVHVRGILASISEDSSDSRADVVDFPKIPAHNKFLKR